MSQIKFALQVFLLALLILLCLFGLALVRTAQGCPITQPNCVYVVNGGE